jgi:hypothetical protein
MKAQISCVAGWEVSAPGKQRRLLQFGNACLADTGKIMSIPMVVTAFNAEVVFHSFRWQCSRFGQKSFPEPSGRGARLDSQLLQDMLHVFFDRADA